VAANQTIDSVIEAVARMTAHILVATQKVLDQAK
jgi:hypothetical protein